MIVALARAIERPYGSNLARKNGAIDEAARGLRAGDFGDDKLDR